MALSAFGKALKVHQQERGEARIPYRYFTVGSGSNTYERLSQQLPERVLSVLENLLLFEDRPDFREGCPGMVFIERAHDFQQDMRSLLRLFKGNAGFLVTV